jgi:hypothetical protein
MIGGVEGRCRAEQRRAPQDTPNLTTNIGNSGDLYGSVIISSIRPTSGVKFHYDTASASSGVVGNYHVTSFNWSRF